MIDYLSAIQELESIREEKNKLKERELRLNKPKLDDFTLIPELYEKFVAILNERPCPPRIDSVLQRKKFILIILFLYSPSTLIGERLPYGLRKVIMSVFPNISPNSISIDISNLLFLYKHYKDINNEVSEMIPRLIEDIHIRE